MFTGAISVNCTRFRHTSCWRRGVDSGPFGGRLRRLAGRIGVTSGASMGALLEGSRSLGVPGPGVNGAVAADMRVDRRGGDPGRTEAPHG